MIDDPRTLMLSFTWLRTTKRWLLEWQGASESLVLPGNHAFVAVQEPMDDIGRARVLAAVKGEMTGWMPYGLMSDLRTLP